MNYRDIRADLKQRIEDLRANKKRFEEDYRAKLKEFDDTEGALQKLLDTENRLFHTEPATPIPTEPTFPGTATEAALFALQDGEALQLEEIKEKAGMLGLGGDGKLGRILHGALVSLKREGKVERLDDGAWKRIVTTVSTRRGG